MYSDPVKSKRQHKHKYTVPVIHIRAVELEVYFFTTCHIYYCYTK